MRAQGPQREPPQSASAWPVCRRCLPWWCSLLVPRAGAAAAKQPQHFHPAVPHQATRHASKDCPLEFDSYSLRQLTVGQTRKDCASPSASHSWRNACTKHQLAPVLDGQLLGWAVSRGQGFGSAPGNHPVTLVTLIMPPETWPSGAPWASSAAGCEVALASSPSPGRGCRGGRADGISVPAPKKY